MIYISLYTRSIIMDFNDFKSNINIIKSCDELGEPYTFERFLTTLQNVVLDLDKIQEHVDVGVAKINNILDK